MHIQLNKHWQLVKYYGFKSVYLMSLWGQDANPPNRKGPTMRKGHNTNHPAKGSTTKVEPIRQLKDIKSIKRLLQKSPRDLCLFTFGINTNLRASDMLKITAGQVRGLKPGGELALKEMKTGKHRRMPAAIWYCSFLGGLKMLVQSPAIFFCK